MEKAEILQFLKKKIFSKNSNFVSQNEITLFIKVFEKGKVEFENKKNTFS